jgi:predicted ATPase with chaperone activity
VIAPEAPTSIEESGIDPDVLCDHALRMAYTLPQFTTAKAANILCLPMSIVTELLEKLRTDKLIENLGQAGPIDYRFAVTSAGRERGKRLFEISCYAGPVPVSLELYTANLEEQLRSLPPITPEAVEEAISDLVLPHDARDIVGLAGSSMRSFFIYGPPGNGKTSLGHLLHNAMEGELWIPNCIGIDNSIIRIFDPRFHVGSPFVLPQDQAHRLDRRWVRIRRPFVVVGGELTTAALDLGYSAELGYYEAPLHLKANGGTFLLDDLGFQKDEAHDILARWIYPLENHVDHLSLHTGQKLQVPFRQKLVVSTNMDPDTVMNPAFLRRMGYRLYLGDPTPEAYVQIFHEYAASVGVEVPDGLTDWLLDRYKKEDRPLRGCEPRDLIERARDLCHFQQVSMRLDEETLRLAWRAYFGNEPS